MTKRYWQIGIIALGMAGCAQEPVKPAPPPDPVMVSLNATAHRIRRELALLRRLQQTHTAHPIPYRVPPGRLGRPIQLSWSGRLTPAVRAVAVLLGPPWTITRIGHPPPQPVIVSIRARKVPAFQVLESLGWQAGRRAGVVVNPATHVIQVTYVGH